MKNAKDFYQEMTAVQAAVVKLTGHEETKVVHFNGHILQVVLINSKYNEMEGEEKGKASLEIAQTAYRTLKSKDSIDEVMVVFHIHGTKLGIEYNNSLDSHKFSASELEPDPTPSEAPQPEASPES